MTSGTLVGHAGDVVRAWGVERGLVHAARPAPCGVFGVCNAPAMLVAGRPLAMMPAWDARLAAELIERHRVHAR
jgi:hypothetical protein